jgi:hypothetical protein
MIVNWWLGLSPDQRILLAMGLLLMAAVLNFYSWRLY